MLGVEGSAPVSNSRCYVLTNEAETIAGPDSSLGEVRTALLRLLSIWLVCQRVDTVTDYSPQSCARFIIGLLDLGQVRLLSHCFPPFCGIKKAHGFVLIHALGGLYSVVREFGSLQKGKNTFFTSAKSLVKISTVETAKPPIKSGVSWAISFSLPFDGRGSRIRTHDTRFWRPLLYQLSYAPMYLCLTVSPPSRVGGPSGTRTPDQPVMSRWL